MSVLQLVKIVRLQTIQTQNEQPICRSLRSTAKWEAEAATPGGSPQRQNCRRIDGSFRVHPIWLVR